MPTKLGAIGDIHGFWDARDTAYFNASDYDALLFVGDLPRLTGGLGIARELARLEKPAWMIPGNHDGVTALQLLSELKGWRLASRLGALGMHRRVRRLARALGPVRLAGFELHTLSPDLGLLVARPHAMGPDKYYYRRYLARRFGAGDFEASANTLKTLLDAAPRRVIVLAHNGPAGLGNAPDAPWGCDFSDKFGDFGDPDLSAAIAYARDRGRIVPAVIAGHMHHRSKSGGERRTWAREGETLYVNAARVGRIGKDGRRHHIALTLEGDSAHAEAVFVDSEGRVAERIDLQ